MKKNKKSYVIVSDVDRVMIWPYPEAQEYSIFDLSDSVIYLTDKEFEKIQRKLREKRKI